MAAPGDVAVLPAVLGSSGTLRAERRGDLDGSPASARDARRLVAEALFAAGHEEWAVVTELAISEVVTNAVLHAHTAIQIWIGVFEDEVCVEVRDFSTTLPVERDYDLEATTGRGMGLVSGIAKSCGTHGLADGKVVWFCVGDQSADADPDDVLAMWDIDDLAVTPPQPFEVTLLEMPATLWLAARQHHDAILREVVLYQAQHPDLDLDISSADRARFTIATAVLAAVDAASADGTAAPVLPEGHPSPLPWVPRQLNLRVPVEEGAASLFATLQDVLDTAERLAIEGKLLCRPGLPEIVAVRDWACEQVIAQLVGNDPSPWPGTDQERFEREVNDTATPAVPDWDPSIVSEASTRVIAVDDANRIVAVSTPLADVLGWDPAELSGRRVVAVIPPALREAHVAGFSRHLSTGEAHVLGVPLTLPVLRRDGTEVQCRFLIERAPTTAGRAVYLAQIDPLEPGD